MKRATAVLFLLWSLSAQAMNSGRADQSIGSWALSYCASGASIGAGVCLIAFTYLNTDDLSEVSQIGNYVFGTLASAAGVCGLCTTHHIHKIELAIRSLISPANKTNALLLSTNNTQEIV